MHENIEKALKIWHKHYEKEENQYSEFEPSDIEYFIGCMLYNHFSFSKAVSTMKTVDLSYDFLSSCGDAEYEEIKSMVEAINFENESEAVDFLIEYIREASMKYTRIELYLLDRLLKHVLLLKERYVSDVDPKSVDFQRLRFH